MNHKRVTIAIPCYKQAEFLPDAIESALNQTYKDLEVIVVNDGSPDKTSEIAKNYGVRVIDQVNKGLASARNSAIMAMTGGLFFPLDADDLLEPTAIEKLVQLRYEGTSVVIAPSMKCFGIGNETIEMIAKPTLKDFVQGNRIPYASLVDKEVLEQVGGYSPRMEKGWEDYHLWINILTKGYTIDTTPEALLLYRTKENSMWKEAEKHKAELLGQIYKDFPDFYGYTLFPKS